MSHAQLNTIASHPLISCSFHLPALDQGIHAGIDTQQDVYVAGGTVDGVLHLSTLADKHLCYGKIEVELVAREDARTSRDALGRVFWAHRVPFQGPGLPPCNAVTSERNDSLPKGYHFARKGSTSFPLSIPLPASLPPSFSMHAASITYTLHVTIELAERDERRILHVSRVLQVVPGPASFNRECLNIRVGRGEMVVGGERGGRVEVELRNDALGAWAVEGGIARAALSFVNDSGQDCSLQSFRLLRRLRIDFGGKLPVVLESVEAERTLFDWEPFHAYQTRIITLDLPLPVTQRSVARVGIAIEVAYALHVALTTSNGSSCAASVPLELLHPASLPAELWLSHEARLSEIRAGHVVTPQMQPSAPRRWSTPIQTVSELFNGFPLPRSTPPPSRRLSGLPPRSMSLDLAPVRAYSQPDWVVHALPSLAEEPSETKAERTSRHLRETSGHRGRSVSPPPAPDPLPISPPRLRRPPSVAGPRPAPNRSVSALRPPAPAVTAVTTPAPAAAPQSTPPVPMSETVTPPLLSPMPQQMEPNSYFDYQVHSLTPETPLDYGKLSPATIKSLEDYAESLETPPGLDNTLPGSPDEIRAKARSALESPIRERRSVMSVFDFDQSPAGPGRPEATRRESSERRVEVEMRHMRESSMVPEILDELSATPEGPLSRTTTPFRASPASTSPFRPSPASTQPSHLAQSSQTSQTARDHPRSASGSMRGRGGQVAAVRQKFAELERAASPPASTITPSTSIATSISTTLSPSTPSSAEKKIRRKSVPGPPPATTSIPLSSPFNPAGNRPIQSQRHSMAIGPGHPVFSSPKTAKWDTPMSRPLAVTQQSYARHSIETPTEPLSLESSREARKTFDRVLVEPREGHKGKKSGKAGVRGAAGAVGRLKALIERFERW